MSIAIMSQVWASALPMTEKMVLLCLADFANDRGECWPSVDTIAGKCSCSDRTVQKAIKNLKDWGILTFTSPVGKPHTFTINPRTSFTPERPSPPKESAKGVKQLRHGGERPSPKPSMNHQEPSEKEKARACRLPDGWQPKPLTADLAAAVACWPDGAINRELARFRDWAASASGPNARKSNWDAAWRNWIRKAEDDGRYPPVRNGQPTDGLASLRGNRPNPALDMVLQAERELQAEAEREGAWTDWSTRSALPSC